MQWLIKSLTNHPYYIWILVLLLLIPALFINIGLMPLLSDEPTRAIVTLEMMVKGNYITPTINGEFYYNKPPLFNWILAGFAYLTGNLNEVIFRLPTVISLLLFALAIFLIGKKEIGKTNAAIAGLMFVTSSRILFWDSFQGLIDITYSLVTFCSFAALYVFSEKRKFLLLFAVSYLLTAIGYLMKGLPSLAFQAISVVVWLGFIKEIRKLFSWQHLVGIGVFLLVTGLYYFAYLQTNSLQDVFSTLFDQSNRIKDKEGTILSWTIHLFKFPLDLGYEFAPWTVLLLLLFNKEVRGKTMSAKFLQFCLLIFASNIIIYWISADMRPRYLFMLVPLLFLIAAKAYHESQKVEARLFRMIDLTLQIFAFIGSFSILYYLFWSETNQMSGVWIYIPLLFIVSVLSAYFSLKMKDYRLLFILIVLLCVRISFNLFNLPARYNSYPDATYRQDEIMAGRLTGDYDLFILGDTPVNHDASFYITRERKQILTRTSEIKQKPAFYLTDKKNLANFADRLVNYKIYKKFTIKLMETELYLIKSE